MITKELLLSKLASFEQQFEQLKNNLNATSGAIQFTKHLLAELEKLEIEGKQKAQEVEQHTKEIVNKILG